MEDRWGDILYLVFMVLLLIVGAIKKGKAGKLSPSEPKSQPEEKEPASGLEVILESMLEGKEEFAAEEKGTAQSLELESVPENQISVTRRYTEKKQRSSLRGEDPFSSDIFTLGNVVKESYKDLEGEEEECPRIDFSKTDWQDAIIYSEIMNRKYN